MYILIWKIFYRVVITYIFIILLLLFWNSTLRLQIILLQLVITYNISFFFLRVIIMNNCLIKRQYCKWHVKKTQTKNKNPSFIRSIIKNSLLLALFLYNIYNINSYRFNSSATKVTILFVVQIACSNGSWKYTFRLFYSIWYVLFTI